MLIVKRYARALFESARESGNLESVKADIEFLEQLLESAPEIRAYCLKSHRDLQKEQEFVKTAFIPYVSSLTGRMLALMGENGRLGGIPFLAEAFAMEEAEASETRLLEIEAPRELSSRELQDIEEKMRKRTGGEILSRMVINPSLLGGIRLTWENRTLDLSLKGRIQALKTKLR